MIARMMITKRLLALAMLAVLALGVLASCDNSGGGRGGMWQGGGDSAPSWR